MNNSSFPSPWYEFYDKGVILEGYCDSNNLCELFDKSVLKYPQNIAISYAGLDMTYEKFGDVVGRMAARLQKHGLKPGERVAIMLPNLPQLALALFAIVKAGGVFVMINPAYTERELTYQINDAGVKYIICLDIFWTKFAALQNELSVKKYFITGLTDWLPFPRNYIYKFKNLTKNRKLKIKYDKKSVYPWTDLLEGKNGVPSPNVKGETLVALLYTGGTTGESKGVMLTHQNLCVNIYQILNFLTPKLVNQRHVFMATLPYFHVYGLMINLLTPIALGGTIVPFPRFAPHELLKTMNDNKATVFAGSPAMFMTLLRTKEIKKCDLSSLVLCLCGSAPIPIKYLKKFSDLTGVEICEAYGLTEASPITHMNPIQGLHKTGSIGVPLPGTNAKVVDMELGTVEVPNGKAGELIIKGPQVMQGYWQRPDDTASTLRNGWLYTGDIAIMDDDGYFFIVDRKKDMAIVGGYNVYPREIDEVLHKYPNIKDAVSVGIPCPSRGEIIKAYIVPEEGITIDKAELIAYCREHLALFKVPRQIEFRSSLPRTMVGKVLRRVLRAEEIEKQESKNSSTSVPSDEA